MILDDKLTCPKCGSASSMRSFANEELQEIINLASKFGSRWPWVSEYLHSFQVDHDKPLRPAKLKALIGEIQEMIDKHGFRFEKKQHVIRPEALFQAMRAVALKNMVGLKTHGYLMKVVIDFNQKMIAVEEREQKIREEEAMNRLRRDPKGSERLRDIIGGLKRQTEEGR